MERAKDAAPESQAGAELPMEPVGSLLPGLEQPQVPAEMRQPEGRESSLTPAGAVEEAAGAGREPSSEKQLPSPLPGPLRVPPLSLGYGAFGRLGSACPEPPSPGPAAAEPSQNSEAPGAQPAPGAWAPIELQVDVLVKPVGAASGSRTPSPRPSTRFLKVPVPESPAFSRSAAPAHQLLQRAPSPGCTWGRGSPLAAARTESTPAEGSAGSPSSPTCCRCKELGLEKEGAALLPCAGLDRDKKLPRAVTHLGLSVYMKSLHRALAVMAVLLAVSGVVIVVLASRAGTRCQPCPPGWVLSEEHCYYLSAEAQGWEASQAFCSAYHATLPLLSHTQDLLSRYPVSKHSWVGAQRGPQGWHWIDGAPLPPQLLPEDGENNPDINCGALEEGTLVAANCSTPRRWVCAKGTQ
ncbi:killer cell lectin-like receptor subfamily G member 2 [Cebus imitator]|uniref:killer cell lectin-like receptor subfamily G member 2 n=1 Tax=Cebus imitator TaxID=2715852 RepID=UPI000809A4D5|nr:killer cell lectin-like receptor subfamily G member 2 [Cebus imitator]